jgi:hypothetical protein
MVSMGLLAPGATPLSTSKGKGVNETWKGRVHLLDGSSVPAYVKLLDTKQLSNELFGAELARIAGFQVPDTYLVRVNKSDHEAMFDQLRFPTDQVVAFGSRDAGVKSLARRYRDEGMAFANWFAMHCPRWKRVVSFDSWIANIDRHFGNALVGGPDELWLIDHGHCFTGPAWSEPQLQPSAMVVNRLINELTPFLTSGLRDAVAAEAYDAQKAFDVVHVEGAFEDCHAGGLITASERAALISFVEHRKARVIEFVHAALGRPMLPLAGGVQ